MMMMMMTTMIDNNKQEEKIEKTIWKAKATIKTKRSIDNNNNNINTDVD